MTTTAPKQSRSRYYVSKRAKGSTSAKRIRREQRIAEALDFRLQGHSIADIAKELKIARSTARQYILEGTQKFIAPEHAQQVLAMELARLDRMQAAIFSLASEGSTTAIEATLRIMHHRSRLLGLAPDKSTGIAVSIGGSGGDVRDAEALGIQVTFVRSPLSAETKGTRTIEGELLGGKGDGLPVLGDTPVKP